MNSECDNPESSSGRRFHTVRPGCNLESNWAIDLLRNLDEYLLKICSGQVSQDEDAIFNVNFAEAALLLQGSVQVYSRKVEYLYSLVLHALDFISQKSQEDQATSSAAQAETSTAPARDEIPDSFWGLDDILVNAKNLLDCSNSGDATPSHFVRPPANLVVLEGECLDAVGESGELESYLLATNHLYRDFVLLDSCDAVAVDNFLDRGYEKGPTNTCMISSAISKGQKSFLSPYRQSGSTATKLIVKKKQDANITQTPCVNHGFEPNDDDMGCSPAHNFSQDNNNGGFGMGSGYSEPGGVDDSDEDEDPWKPLNPHEPGNLKVKPYKRVKARRKLDVGSGKHQSLITEFPLANLHGPISAELSKVWEARQRVLETHGNSQSLPLYEKLRQSLVAGEKRTNGTFYNPENDIDENGYDSGDPDTGPPEFGVPNDTFSCQDIPPPQEHREGPEASASLENLCRSHLDALLATLAENEKQSELATRVSSWKLRIEQNLEEQDAHPPFDIHRYGESVLDKLSAKAASESPIPFRDVVDTHNKYDVARTFSALLQLVNNGDVDLVRNNPTSSTCYSNANPFHVRLLRIEKKNNQPLKPFKRRARTPPRKMKSAKGKENCHASSSIPHRSSSSSGRFSINLRKASRSRCTPEGKNRRKSPIVAPLNMQFVVDRGNTMYFPSIFAGLR